ATNTRPEMRILMIGKTTDELPRVAVGGILTECNHFGGLPIDMSSYEASELFRGDELLQQTTSVVGGMLSGLRERNAAPVPLIFASVCSAGPMTRECYHQLKGECFERLERALPVDGVLLPLHGSALVDGLDDPEGDMIQAARDLVGPDVPIVVTLDLHAHVTEQMVRHADALIAWETYPHRDQYTTGQRATRLLFDILAGKCQPTMAMGKVPVITSAIHGSTNNNDPFADLMRFTKLLEQRDGVLSTSLFLIHPYMDCENMGSGGVVVTDNDPHLAETLAGEIANRYWERRHDLEPEMFTPIEAIAKGLQVDGGPVILVEAADCCGGGAAGDSIAALYALVESGNDMPSIVPVVDPEAAQACHTAGEGAELSIAIGHRLDPRWGSSRTFTGKVEQLSDGNFVYTGGQWDGRHEHMGRTAVFRIGPVRVIIMSRATYDWADEQIRSVGLNPSHAKFIVAKNPMNYRLAYGDIAKAVIVLDTPGPTPATLKHVRFRKLSRPYFPADVDIPGLQPTIMR
ncbi:MAG: M81 family metallopeptidase, partial [Fuerstiella sp.]